MAYNRIEIPTLVREPLPWNLAQVGTDVTPSNDRWTSGITWREDSSDAARIWDPNATGASFADKDFTPGLGGALTDNPSAVLYGVHSCPTSSGEPDKDDVDDARRRLDAGSSAGLEALFWSWALDAATEIVTGSPGVVVSQLGQAMSDTGLSTQGILHMPARSAEVYLSQNGFNPSLGNAPLTNRGDRVSIGAGYTNVGTPTSQWVIISGPLGYLLSDIEVIESPENITSSNTTTLLAERYAAIQVDTTPLFKGLIQYTDEYTLEGGLP